MTTLTQPRPVEPTTGCEGLAHLYCCDEDRAWCGADISGEPVCLDEDCCPECSLCWLAEPTLTCDCDREEPRTDA